MEGRHHRPTIACPKGACDADSATTKSAVAGPSARGIRRHFADGVVAKPKYGTATVGNGRFLDSSDAWDTAQASL